MATLILTTAGSAIAGPIGAAIGGLLGNAVDRTILRPRGRQGPRLTELAVQTSSYGTWIPNVFGTMRVAGTVIWATDLIETRDRQSGAKGQPSVTTYSYAASFAVALSGRPIRSVGRIWAEGKLLRGAAGDWKTPAVFRLHRGGEDQAADPLIASAEGGGLAPAHRGIGYVVFENLPLADFGNRIPSLTFEVTADDGPVTLGRIAAAVSGGVVSGDVPGPSVHGFSAYGDGARGVLETLGQAGGAWFAPLGDGLVMRSDAGTVRLVADEGTAAGGRRMATIDPIAAAPRALSVAHYDPARDYQTGVQRAVRPGAGTGVEAIEMPAALSADAAKTMAEAMLLRAERGRVRRRVSSDVSALAIGPGDCVTVTGESGVWRVRTATLEKMAVTLELTPVVAATLPAAATGGRVLAAPDVAVGATVLHAFETPVLDDAVLSVPRLTIVAAGTAPGWRRAALLISTDDGASWAEAGGTAAAGTVGTVVSPPGVGSDLLIDRVNAIVVTLLHDGMALYSADARAIDRGANLALVGSELLQFERAARVGARTWRLTGLWRARRGLAAAHDGGERFVMIDAASAVALPVGIAPGATVRVMASGAGDVGGPAETSAIINGASILPPAPVAGRMAPTGDGGTTVSWTRRTRAAWRWSDAVDVPLGEEREQYRVTVAPHDGPVRTIVTPNPAAAVTADERAFGPVTIAIRQIGTNGESAALTATF